MNAFEEKRQNRIERLAAMASKSAAQAQTTYDRAHSLASQIPFGQPILVGHHSEKRDRNFRSKITRTFEKSFDLQDKAKYYQSKAAAAANNDAIFSDDPNALEKLQEKIVLLEKHQRLMREFNKAHRKNDRQKMLELGFSEAMIEELCTPSASGRVAFPCYKLTNNNANIRRLKERLRILTVKAQAKTTEIQIGIVRIVDNVEDNRLQMFFPDKPSEPIRKELKSSGFRWSPTSGAWQRHRSNAAIWEAKRIAKGCLES